MKNVGKGKINNKNNIIKRWWKLCNPHKGYFFGQIFFMCVYSLFLSLITIFTARTTTLMFAGDWNGAFLNLFLALLTIIIRNLALHTEYFFYCKENGYIRVNITNKIYRKTLSCKKDAISDVSIEKIVNIAINNMGYASDFPDVIAVFTSKIVQVVFTLVIVFSANITAGLIVSALGVLNFFVYYLINKKLGKLLLERYEKKDDMFKSYSKVIDGKDIITEMSAEEKYKREIVGNVKKFNNLYEKYYMLYSFKENVWFMIWNVIVYAISALLLFYASKGMLGLEIYLIIVPYLTSCTEKLCNIFEKTKDVENLRIDVDRINLILNLSDKDVEKFGNLNRNSIGYNLGLVNICEKKKNGQKYNLNNVTMSFAIGEINVVKGDRDCGKRVIFDILRRYTCPDKGMVILDNLNLFDYSDLTFHSHINYATSYPFFINGTIAENLTISKSSLKNAIKICKELGIYSEISKLQKGFNSNIREIKNETTLYFLGVARALLTNCKIFMLYEFPDSAMESEKNKIINLITKFKIDKTLIIFTHSNIYDKYAQIVYKVEKGKVTKEK